MKEDKIVEDVISEFRKRSELGQKKYNTTLMENNDDDFLQHATEEVMDLLLYLKKIQSILKEKGYDNLNQVTKI